MDAEISDAQEALIWSLMQSRRVSASCAAEIIRLLVDQPDPEIGYPSQTEFAKVVKQRIERDDHEAGT